MKPPGRAPGGSAKTALPTCVVYADNASRAIERSLADVRAVHAVAAQGEADGLRSDPARAVEDVGRIAVDVADEPIEHGALARHRVVPVVAVYEVVLGGQPVVEVADRRCH
jgi:hypothetical protein